MAITSCTCRQFIVHLTILIIVVFCIKAVQAQPPELTPGPSTSPEVSGQPDARPLAAGGADDIKPEVAGGAVSSTDGAWGGENTTSSALDAVQPLPENQERRRQSKREQWMRERAVASDGSLGHRLTRDDREEGQEEDQGHSHEAGQGDANVSGQNSASHSISSHKALSGGHVQLEDPEGAELNTNHVASLASAAPQEALSGGHVQLEDPEGAELNTNHVASSASAAPQEAPNDNQESLLSNLHLRDGAVLCTPSDALDYGQNHSVHPQSHCDPWLNIHMRCGYDIQHPDLGDSEYVDLAWERSQRAAARRHGRGGQRLRNIQPEDDIDSTRTVDMQHARRPRRIMQGRVLLLVLLQALMVMYMVLVFDTALLHATLNGHLQGDCGNAQYAVMDFRLLQMVVCLLVLAIWILM